MQIVARDQLHRRADQRQRARRVVLRQVHRPFGQRQLRQEAELAQVAVGLAEAGELDVRARPRRLRITAGVAESPIRNAASIVPASSCLAASSPVSSSSTVGGPSISFAFSSFSASTRVPLPSGPDRQALALELRQHLDRLRVAAVDHQRLRVDAAQRHQVRQVAPLGQPALHEADVDLDRRVRELVQVVERAARREDLDLHAVAREDLLVLLRLVAIAAAVRAAGEVDRLRRREAGRLHRDADGGRRDEDRRQADDDQVAPRRRR